jgi:uncharacterized protein YbjQ (UPF0145 family)
MLVNTETVPGKNITEVFGLVKGNVIRAKWFGKDFIAGLRHIVGGELKEYTELLAEAREQATNRMIQEAEKLGANAIVNVRYITAEVTAGAAEILAYGTAVKVQ